MPTHGTVAPGFEPVREAFDHAFTDLGELGAGVAVFHRGRLVVDLWGGWTDATRTTSWRRDTIVHTYSTIKPMVAACALILVDRGLLALDSPVATWWPELGQGEAASATLRQLLSHQAGLVALRDDVPADEILDWNGMIARLEAEPPWWEPGTALGEHAYFYGHLVGELVRRTDPGHRSLARFLAEELASPWNLDLQVGVRPGDRGRVAPLSGLETLFPGGHPASGGPLYDRALSNPPGMLLPDVVNSAAWMAAEVPAVNGFATAEGVARFYHGLLEGGTFGGNRVLTEALCRAATSPQVSGHDLVLDRDVTWGLGVQLEEGPEGGSFGHGGVGGSAGYAVPSLALAFGYVTNLMAGHDRGDAVADAAEACAAALAD
jgi:CubicO group peptidase (beta-lactamase class C family)